MEKEALLVEKLVVVWLNTDRTCAFFCLDFLLKPKVFQMVANTDPSALVSPLRSSLEVRAQAAPYLFVKSAAE